MPLNLMSIDPCQRRVEHATLATVVEIPVVWRPQDAESLGRILQTLRCALRADGKRNDRLQPSASSNPDVIGIWAYKAAELE